MCIDYRLRNKQAAAHDQESAREPSARESARRAGEVAWREYDNDDREAAPDDNQIRIMMNNYRREGVQRACRVDSERRAFLREHTFDMGFQYNYRRDLDFTITLT
jgi:hypothetical protein